MRGQLWNNPTLAMSQLHQHQSAAGGERLRISAYDVDPVYTETMQASKGKLTMLAKRQAPSKHVNSYFVGGYGQGSLLTAGERQSAFI